MSSNDEVVHLDPCQLRDYLCQDDKTVLLVDCRRHSDYSQSHIRSAVNLTLPTLLLKRLRQGKLKLPSMILDNSIKELLVKNVNAATTIVVLYEQCTTNANFDQRSILSVIKHRMVDETRRVLFLDGGFEIFERCFPDFCENAQQATNIIQPISNVCLSGCRSNFVLSNGIGNYTSSCTVPKTSSTFWSTLMKDQDCCIPVQILSYLYIGSVQSLTCYNTLQRYNITHIINVSKDIPNLYEDIDVIKHLRIPVSDHWSQNICTFFSQTYTFIEDASSKKTNILVHCQGGKSRSSTIVIAYLMSKLHICFDDAYNRVKSCKPDISPNVNFIIQLLKFEQDLGIVK